MKKAKLYKKDKTNSRKFGKKRNKQLMGYDFQWDRYRRRFIHHNPRCYACGEKANVVDHIVAHKGDIRIFKALNNHMPLCNRCHNTITASFDRYNPPRLDEKAKWLQEKREICGCNIKIKVLGIYEK